MVRKTKLEGFFGARVSKLFTWGSLAQPFKGDGPAPAAACDLPFRSPFKAALAPHLLTVL